MSGPPDFCPRCGALHTERQPCRPSKVESVASLCVELRRCASTFDAYAAGHAAKGTPEGHEKAQRNREHANRIRETLARARAAGIE